MKRTGFIISLILAIIFAINGILILTLRAQLLNSAYYQTALSQSGIYQTTSSILQTQVTDGLITLQKSVLARLGVVDNPELNSTFDRVIILVLNTVIETQTDRFVNDSFNNLQVAQSLENLVNAGIESDIAWLTGERQAHEFFSYIPTPEQVQSIQSTSLNDIVTQLTTEASGISELPTCDSDFAATDSYQAAVNGRIANVTCTNAQIQPLLDARIQEIVPSDRVDQAESQLTNTLDAFGITPILNSLYDLTLFIAQLKQSLLELRSFVALSYNIGVFNLVLSAGFAILTLFLAPSRRWFHIINIYMISGASLLVISLLQVGITTPLIIYNLSQVQIQNSNGFLTAPQVTALQSNINFIVEYLSAHLFDVTIRYAVLLIAISALLYILRFILMLPRAQRMVADSKSWADQHWRQLQAKVQ